MEPTSASQDEYDALSQMFGLPSLDMLDVPAPCPGGAGKSDIPAEFLPFPGTCFDYLDEAFGGSQPIVDAVHAYTFDAPVAQPPPSYSSLDLDMEDFLPHIPLYSKTIGPYADAPMPTCGQVSRSS